MDKIIRMTFCLMTFAAGLFLYHPACSACEVNEFYLTQEGYLAAPTPEKLNEAIGYQEKNDREQLAAMIKNGTIIKLEGEIKVRVEERSVEYRMLKIKFLNKDTPYWVKDGALKPIKCN